MDNGGVLWRDLRAPPGAGRERNAMQGAAAAAAAARSLCAWSGSRLLVLGPWSLVLCLCSYARMSFSASIGPVNSNPSAVEVSAKAGLAGLCRL